MNQAILVGRVGNDPEIRTTQGGDKCANISLATSERWNDKNGNKQERTEWHRCVIWGKLAEVVEKYVQKGDQLLLQGKIQTRKWQDSSGNDRWSTEIVLSGFGSKLEMLGSPSGKKQEKQEEPGASEPEDKFEDEIPF